MYKPSLAAVRLLELDADLATHCSWCRHSKFVHTESGPCLFSECRCRHFFPPADAVKMPGQNHDRIFGPGLPF